MSTDGRGTNNNVQVRTKFAERWYARSNRAVIGNHMRHQGSGINRLQCCQSTKKVDKYMYGRWRKMFFFCSMLLG